MRISALAIDKDLAFAFWVAKILDGAGYEAFPARSMTDALELLADIEMNLQLVILSGAPQDAETALPQFRQRCQGIRVLRLVEENDGREDRLPGVDLEIEKPRNTSENDRAELLLVVERMLASKSITGAAGSGES